MSMCGLHEPISAPFGMAQKRAPCGGPAGARCAEDGSAARTWWRQCAMAAPGPALAAARAPAGPEAPRCRVVAAPCAAEDARGGGTAAGEWRCTCDGQRTREQEDDGRPRRAGMPRARCTLTIILSLLAACLGAGAEFVGAPGPQPLSVNFPDGASRVIMGQVSVPQGPLVVLAFTGRSVLPQPPLVRAHFLCPLRRPPAVSDARLPCPVCCHKTLCAATEARSRFRKAMLSRSSQATKTAGSVNTSTKRPRASQISRSTRKGAQFSIFPRWSLQQGTSCACVRHRGWWQKVTGPIVPTMSPLKKTSEFLCKNCCRAST